MPCPAPPFVALSDSGSTVTPSVLPLRDEPLFSIGVTTYRRTELLRETLGSIAEQPFEDLEVIVGNDYPREPLSRQALSISDPRIRIVNHPRTLGEIGNMQALLAEARGRYFTWLADDDLYAPNFLEAVLATLTRFDFPPCVYTSYASGDKPPPPRTVSYAGRDRSMSGSEFRRAYLERDLKLHGCYGVFDTEALRELGGMEKLGSGFSPYSDVLLGIRAGSLDRVVFVDAPLIFYRTHADSISLTSPDVEAYASAQRDLCAKSFTSLRREGSPYDSRVDMYLLLRWCVGDFASVIRRAGAVSWRQVARYLGFLIRNLPSLGWSMSVPRFLILLPRIAIRTFLDLVVDRRKEAHRERAGTVVRD